MAISHLCMSCGHDLARARALLEPHYGLPLVTCPHCGTHAVRRRHPILTRWRFLLRLKTTVLVLLAQTALAVGLTMGTFGVCMFWARQAMQRSIDLGDEHVIVALFLSFVVLPACLGLWLTAGLGHWRAGTQWATVAGIVMLLLCLDTLVAPIVTRLLVAAGSDQTPMPWGVQTLLARGAALGIVLVIAAAGVAPGRGLLHVLARFRAGRWRARRRRYRARRIHG